MSGTGGATTFSQPASPTSGLQRYNLEGTPKNLVRDTSPAARRFAWKKRLASLRSGRGDHANSGSARTTGGKAAQLKKVDTMLKTKLPSMIDALMTSVADIRTAGGADESALLAKSFSEFKDALLSEHESELGSVIATPQDLFKNLGTVGQIGNMVADLDRRIELIKSAGGDIDPEIELLLDTSVAAATVALNKAVNAECELPDDSVLQKGAPEGKTLINVPTVEGETVVLSTGLPEALYKMAVDPAMLDERVAEIGVTAFQLLGVPDERIEGLFKADPVPPKKKPAQPAADGGADDGADTDDNPGAPEMQGNDGQDGGADPSGDDPITVAMRIAAALMIQLQHIQEIVEGGADDGTYDDQDGAGADAPKPPPSGASVTKATPAGRLAKTAPLAPAADPRVDALIATIEAQKSDIAELVKTVSVVGESLHKVLATPLPAKGVISGIAASPNQGGAQYSEVELRKMYDELPEDQKVHVDLLAAFKQGPEPRFRS